MKLYDYQLKYLENLPKNTIMAADVGCFAKNTPVWTPKGKKAIDTLKSGDSIYAYDGEKLIKTTVDFMVAVTNKPKPMIQFMYDESKTPIRATYDHPFYDGEKYYPLYQLIWRKMEASQRVQLKLLCEQYGTNLDDTSARGITHSDNETWERPVRSSADSDEWENGQSTSSGGTDMDTEYKEPSVYQSQRRQSEEQPDKESGVVYAEAKQPARVQDGAVVEVTQGGTRGTTEDIHSSPVSPNMEHGSELSADRYMVENSNVRRITKDVSFRNQATNIDSDTKPAKVHGIQVLEAETYYAVGVNNIHTYVVGDGLPTHNTGKTIMALEHARRHELVRLVVIAPASKVRTGDWQREIERFFGDEFPEYEVISYEMFSKRWGDFMQPNVTMIIDESHMACNATTKRARAIIKVAMQAHQWIMLSATPLPNGWRSAETYAILTGLSRNKTEFVNRFVIIDRSKGFPLILGYREKELLDHWWKSIAKPLKRTGDLVLPSRMIAIEEPMSKALERTYNKAIKDRIYGDELLDSPSKLFATLRQIPTAVRVDALQSIIEATDEHIVVFYNFNSERDAVLAMLKKSFKGRKIYEQSGHQSKLPSREKWGNLSSSVTLVQYQSGSQAIELTYASITVYLSPCTSYANYEQSKGRTRRNGQDKTTLFYHIAIEGTLDRHIWKILKTKRDFSVKMFENVVDIN